MTHDRHAVSKGKKIKEDNAMLGWLSGRDDAAETARELYGRVVAAARQPEFYRDLGVADTTEGRFEMVAIHLFLALEALRRTPDAADRGLDAVPRLTIEAFVTDMDDCLREMGVGDLTVPKKVKRAAAGFYERSGDYRAALVAQDATALSLALSKHVWGAAEVAPHAAVLGDYVRVALKALVGKTARDVFEPGADAGWISTVIRSRA
ncbi:MAG: ubiquinol-cytochrome C chaperone family protein [Hyphomicrobium sp.]